MTNSFSNFGRVLSDTGRKHESIAAAGHSSGWTDLFRYAVNEVIHGEVSSGLASAKQVAHVITDSRNSEQTGFFVEQGLDFFRREVQTLEEMQHYTRIKRTRSCSHAQTVERCEA